MDRKTMWTILRVVVAILIPNIGGIIGAFFATKANTDGWYKKLNQPALQPPDWVFGPVWFVLNTSLGVASYLVWRDGEGFSGKTRIALVIYAVQVVVNWMWSPIFFGLHSILGGLIDECALLIIAPICCFLFYKINKISGSLFLPYIAWLCFATYLTSTLYKLNPEMKSR